MGDNKSRKTDQSQSERFKEAARELGCDDSEEAFDEALRKVAKAKPKDQPASGRKGKAKG